jgi:hypothetical protein
VYWASPSLIIFIRDSCKSLGEFHVGPVGISKRVALIHPDRSIETNPFTLRGPVPGPSVVIRAPMIVLAFHSLVLLFTILGRNTHPCWMIVHSWPVFALVASLVVSLLEVLFPPPLGLPVGLGFFWDIRVLTWACKAMIVSSSVVL